MNNIPKVTHTVLQDPITKEYHININIRVKNLSDSGLNLNMNPAEGAESWHRPYFSPSSSNHLESALKSLHTYSCNNKLDSLPNYSLPTINTSSNSFLTTEQLKLLNHL